MCQEIAVIGLDLAKNVFQVHAVDAQGHTIVRRQLRWAEVLKFFAKIPPCLVGMEACASAHHWGREIGALGHQVRLMLHKTRDLLVRQRTMLTNALRAHLGEYRIVKA